MNKLVNISLVICALPGLVLFPLAPFTFMIVEGDGLRPGMLHEHVFMGLLLAYPLTLVISIWQTIRNRKLHHYPRALFISTLPLLHALLLVWVYLAGGVQLK